MILHCASPFLIPCSWEHLFASQQSEHLHIHYRNLKGCLTAVPTHCYRGLVQPVLESVSVVWDPHQQHLKSTVELVQQWSVHCILHDFSPNSGASVLVAQLQLENLQSRRTSDKVCMRHKIMNRLVNVNLAGGLRQPRNCRRKETLGFTSTETIKAY